MSALTLALLAVVAVAAGYGIYRIERGERFENQLVAWSTCGMLVCLAIAMLLLGRYLMQRSLGHVERQLRLLAREDRLEGLEARVPDELAAVMAALGEYVEGVRGRVDRLRLQKKELDIQMRTAEAERRNTEAIIFSISDAVLVIDPFGELVLANAAAEALFSFKLAEWRHRPIDRLIQDGAVLALLKEARRKQGAGNREQRPLDSCSLTPVPCSQCSSGVRRQVEYSTLHDGKTQTFNITLSTVVDVEGQHCGVVAVFHDITREREIGQIKTEFVSAVSHELRTPLSSIKAYTEMLIDGEAQDESARREFYRIIDGEAERLQRLISKILDISRIEAGVMDVHRALIDANQVVREVLDIMAPQAWEKDITLESDLGPELPPLLVDRDLLYQAVQNLVANGIKYTPREGHVGVRTSLDQDGPPHARNSGRGDPAQHYAIAVWDTGMGIRAEDLPRIFDKFYRAREGVAAAKGTGLGLNLVKKIVETVHGGEISVASEHGVGTTIALRFPLALDSTRPPEADGSRSDRDEVGASCQGLARAEPPERENV